MAARCTTALAAGALATAIACASPQGPAPEVVEAAAPPTRAELERAAVVSAAESLVGVPYRRGGRSRAGVDCSGLVLYSFAQAGLQGLPRSAEDLERAAAPEELADLRPGDLLFFHLGSGKA